MSGTHGAGSSRGEANSPALTFALAAAAPLRGLALVLHDPPTRGYFFKGLALALGLLVLVISGLLWGGFALTDALLAGGEGFWLAALGVVLKIAVAGLFLLAAPVLFTVLFGLVGGAFLDAVHRRGRQLAGGADYPARNLGQDLKVTARGLGQSLRRLARFLLASLAVAALSLIPVLGVAAVLLEALVVAHAMAWELLVPHFEGRGLSYREQAQFLRRRPGLVLGLGGTGALLLLVPLAQPLALFGSQAGAGALSARLRG